MNSELHNDLKKLRIYLLCIAVFIPWATWWLNIVDLTKIESILYFLILPSLPFVVLAIAASFTDKDGNPDIGKHAIIGAMVGAMLAIGIPYLLLFISAHVDIGVNIGVALLLMAMPIYLPILMLIGWNIGERRDAI